MASLGEAPEIYTILGWFELLFLFGTAHGALICMRDFCGNSNIIDTDLPLSFQNMLSGISRFWPSNGGLWGNAGSGDEKELTSDNTLHVAINIPYFGIYSLLNRRRNAWCKISCTLTLVVPSNPFISRDDGYSNAIKTER